MKSPSASMKSLRSHAWQAEASLQWNQQVLPRCRGECTLGFGHLMELRPSIQLAPWQGSTCPKLQCGLLSGHPSKACRQMPWTLTLDSCRCPSRQMDLVSSWTWSQTDGPVDPMKRCSLAEPISAETTEYKTPLWYMFCGSAVWSSRFSAFRCRRCCNITFWWWRTCRHHRRSTWHCSWQF